MARLVLDAEVGLIGLILPSADGLGVELAVELGW